LEKPVNLAVQIGPLRLKNPVMVASGTFGYGREYADFVAPERLGALVVKGISLKPRAGNPPPRIWETCGGMLNSIGLQNVGLRVFLEEKLPWLRALAVPVVVNIFGNTLDEYGELAAALDGQEGVAALEINISCPNVKEGGVQFGNDPDMSARVVAACRAVTGKPLITKLSPNQTDIAENARRCIEAGTDAFAVINTLTGMAIDIEQRTPIIGNNQGGLSGPAIKPIAVLKVHQVYQVCRDHGIPIIGQGGVCSAEDALEFLIAGATAVGVGTGLFYDPLLCPKINAGIVAYLRRHGLSEVGQLTGSLVLNGPGMVCA
jgi:dihydroorotate dehydrogenase (NAD+) catalytic subunit